MKEYKILLKKIEEKMSPYLNDLGLYFDQNIEKFIGFTEYEVLLIEFVEFLTDTELAINFYRYTTCLEEEYQFAIPEKDHLYGCRDINFSHWKYYPDGINKKDNNYFNQQIEMIVGEMLEQIKIQLEPRILTKYPVSVYIKEKYEKLCDELAMEKHPSGYALDDQWHVENEEIADTLVWKADMYDNEYNYIAQKREAILPYKKYKQKMLTIFEKNKILFQEDARKYLCKYNNEKFITPTRKYYTIGEMLETDLGLYIISELKRIGFEMQNSIGCRSREKEAFYNKKIDFEIYLSIYFGIGWNITCSYPDKHGLLSSCDPDKECLGICFIDVSYKKSVDIMIENFLNWLKENSYNV
jgi:hypothetical protein